MRIPMPPPDDDELLRELFEGQDSQKQLPRVLGLYEHSTIAAEPYLSWDELRFRKPPGDLTLQQWWLAIKMGRRGMQRKLPLVDAGGAPFVYSLTDEVLRQTEYIASSAKGQIQMSEQVTDPTTRDRYLVNQLIEEAITSSQLEGASTSRVVARDMIRTGRPPRDKSERMILNNFHAMQRIGDVRDEALSIDLIHEIHRIVTEGTLEDPTAAGRFQRPDEVRVKVLDRPGGEILHDPPPAAQLPDRMQALCDFANAPSETGYLPGVLRALTIHFMIGYEHPFEDGNGRTARALFYWSMLNQGYWLTELLSVSTILRKAPTKYARAFLDTEQDGNDLTYFFRYNLGVLHRTIDDLNQYLVDKMNEAKQIRQTLRQYGERLNARQLALLQHALRHPSYQYTVQSHRTSHRVSTQTARVDLSELQDLGLLASRKVSKRFVFEPVTDLSEAIKNSGT